MYKKRTKTMPLSPLIAEGLFITAIFSYLTAKEMEGHDELVSKSLAYSSAYTLLVSTPLLILPRLTTFNNALGSKLPRFSRNVNQLHANVAVFMIALTILHGISQIIRKASPVEGDVLVTGTDNNKYALKIVTGTLMLALFVGTSVLARKRHQIRYRNFLYPHSAIALIIALTYALHDPHFRFYNLFGILGAAALYALDRIIGKCLHTHKTELLDSSHTLSENLVQLNIKKPKGFEYMAGQTIELKTSKAGYEWHPVSIVSRTHDDSIRVVIARRNLWTSYVYRRLNELKVSPSLWVRGPHFSPLQKALSEQHLCFISTGIGITPFLSIMSERNGYITAYIIARDQTVFSLAMAAIKTSVFIKMFFYFTGNMPEKSKKAVIRDIARNHGSATVVDADMDHSAGPRQTTPLVIPGIEEKKPNSTKVETSASGATIMARQILVAPKAKVSEDEPSGPREEGASSFVKSNKAATPFVISNPIITATPHRYRLAGQAAPITGRAAPITTGVSSNCMVFLSCNRPNLKRIMSYAQSNRIYYAGNRGLISTLQEHNVNKIDLVTEPRLS